MSPRTRSHGVHHEPGPHNVTDEIRRFYKNLNDRRWSDARSDLWAPDLHVHVPVAGLDATSWEEGMAGIRATVERIDSRYEVNDVVEHGPFVIAFLTVTATLDGLRSMFAACTVARLDDGKIVETSTLCGSEPVPVDAG